MADTLVGLTQGRSVSRVEEKDALEAVRETLGEMETNKRMANIRIIKDEMGATFNGLHKLLLTPETWTGGASAQFVDEAKVLLGRAITLAREFKARWDDESRRA